MVALDGTVRLVSLQFSFSNPAVIPPSVKKLDKETPEERTVRKSRPGGTMFIAPTEKCSLAQFLGELEKAGYELVDALYKERLDAKDPFGDTTYHMVRFLFARREFVESSAEFGRVRETIRAELLSICETALWRVRAFRNPFYKDGEGIAGQYAVSINLEVRQPLLIPDGKPVVARQRDGSGKRSKIPLPLKADCYLHVRENLVCLVTT